MTTLGIESLFHVEEDSQILMGSIGWEDEGEFAYLGAPENDGHTLVRVQLYEGRDITKPLNPKRAQGYKILCHLSGGLFRIPPKDTRVFVAIPKGMMNAPGAGVIFATIEKSPAAQFAKDRVVMDFGPDTHVLIKGKSISMQDPAGRFIMVGTPRGDIGGASGGKIMFCNEQGSGGEIAGKFVRWWAADNKVTKGMITVSDARCALMHTDGASTGYFSVTNVSSLLQVQNQIQIKSAMVHLGKLTAPATAVAYKTPGPGTACVGGSASVFVSVT